VLSVRGRWIAALGLLAAGSAYAGHLAVTPPAAKSAETNSIRLLADRLRSNSAPPVPALGTGVLPSGSRPVSSQATAESEGGRLPAPRTPAQPAPAADGALSVPSGDAGTDTGAKNIALMGVTNSDGEDQAWLVNLDNQEREVVDEGGAAWGFTVKDIEDESIILARGAEQFTLRLGEKEIPVQEAPAPAQAMSESGRRGNWGGRGGDGGSRRDRMRQWMASQGGRWSGRSGRSWGGGGSNWSSSSSSSGSSDWRSRRGDRGSRSSSGRSFSAGGFNPGMGWAMSGGGGNRRGSQTQNTGPTSNPQTARRRGGQLIGGADPIEAPDTITNPQTTRRLGTNSSVAFGEQNNNSRGRNQNRSQRR
jgi:hypothetical protein